MDLYVKSEQQQESFEALWEIRTHEYKNKGILKVSVVEHQKLPFTL